LNTYSLIQRYTYSLIKDIKLLLMEIGLFLFLSWLENFFCYSTI